MSRKKLFLIQFILINLCFSSFGQKYGVNSIPEELRKEVYAVIRKDNTECELLKNNSLRTERTIAITIFDKSGDFLNSFSEFYDSYKKIIEIKMIVYDSHGKAFKTYKKNDFNDYSAISGFSLYEDSRVLTLNPVINSFPYTVEYTYTTTEIDFISFPFWFPIRNEHVSLEESTYTLNLPQSFEIESRFLNIEKSFEVKEVSDRRIFSASIQNIPAIEIEPYSTGWLSIFPHARIVPKIFSRDTYSGSYASWNDFGKWIFSLKEGRDELPENLKAEIQEMIAGCNSEIEKILLLYQYLQNTTRYVNISYGIGGYQPYSASLVYQNGYGDCKALSNYMATMLDYVGIESHYTLVSAGTSKNKIITDFPSQQFNHAIICIPLNGDTLWLECTDQKSPPGYLGRFTDNRTVLLIDKDESRLTRTKKYELEENSQLRRADLFIDPSNMSLQADIKTTYKGQQYGTVENHFHESADLQRDYLLTSIDIPQFRLENYKIQKTGDWQNITGIIELKLTLEKYITKSGDFYFLPLNLMNKNSSAPKPDKNRIHDVYLGYSYFDIDTICYHIPENMDITFTPEDVEINSQFGEYSFGCSYLNNTLLVVRKIAIQAGTYPRESFQQLTEFYSAIMKSDRSKAILEIKN